MNTPASNAPAPLRSVFVELDRSHGLLSESAAAGLIYRSCRTLRRWFTTLHGESFNATQLRIKLSYGARLLMETDLTIPEISDRLGYSERNKFERPFKKMYGWTPADYRERHSRMAVQAALPIDNEDLAAKER